jgi:uncharacterized protein (TIGR02246 family)
MPVGKDTAWLERLHHDFVEAFRSNELKTLGSFYTDDALLLPPSHPMVRGREAIVAFWEGAVRIVDLTFEAIEIKMLGDTAFFETGNLLVVRRTQARQMRNVAAKYASLWLNVDGGWKLESLIWNGAEPRAKRGGGRGRAGQGGGGGGQGRGGRGGGQGRGAGRQGGGWRGGGD